MFFSIRWKAVLLSTFLLFVIMLVWLFHSINRNVELFREEIENRHLQQQSVLQLLVTDNSNKLAQYSQLIANLPAIYSFEEGSELALNGFLESQLFSWNLNFGIDFVAIYSDDYSVLAEAHQIDDSEIYALVKSLTLESLEQSQDAPYDFILCLDGCIQYVVEPFLFDNGLRGFMVIGQNLVDIVLRYQAITAGNIAVLLDEQFINSGYHLSSWGVQIWAITESEKLIPVVESFSLNHDIEDLKLNRSDQILKQSYLIKSLSLEMQPLLGSEAIFVSIEDNQQRLKILRSEIVNNIVIAFAGWLLAELTLLLLMFWPIRRLLRVVEALNLLPKKKYDLVTSMVKPKRHLVYDELYNLEKSTVYLAKELSMLSIQVELSEKKLNDQIDLLSRSRAFLQRLFDNANIFILTQDFSNIVRSYNQLFSNHLANPEVKEVVFLDFFNNQHDKKQFQNAIGDLRENRIDCFQQEINIESLTQKTLTVAWTHSIVIDDNGDEQLLSIGMDVTQRKKDELALNWLANNDTLTKIGNRRAFTKTLELLLSQSKTGAVIFIDVNRFKQINDIYGHLAGDKVLIDIANQLKQATREEDYVCRLAGDEFTVILPSINRSQLMTVLKKLASLLNRTVLLSDKRQVEYSVSLGGALFPEHGRDEQTLIVHSDMAMYKAKKKGVNGWHIFDFNDDQLQELQYEHQVLKELRYALEHNSFVLNFQPIMAVKSFDINHYEVLLRLTARNGEMISPNEFIPIAERGGLIREIDLWVIEKVLSYINQQPKNCISCIFGINISAPSLQDSEFVATLSSLLVKFNTPLDRLIVEITETSYIDNLQEVLESVKKLKEQGLNFALDDFGVGYSSFSYMKELPLSFVKLDGSYVRDLDASPQNAAFIKSVVVMAKAFGMKTIAEYVESKTIFDILSNLEVDYVQGHFIGEPSPVLMNDSHKLVDL